MKRSQFSAIVEQEVEEGRAEAKAPQVLSTQMPIDHTTIRPQATGIPAVAYSVISKSVSKFVLDSSSRQENPILVGEINRL